MFFGVKAVLQMAFDTIDLISFYVSLLVVILYPIDTCIRPHLQFRLHSLMVVSMQSKKSIGANLSVLDCLVMSSMCMRKQCYIV